MRLPSFSSAAKLLRLAAPILFIAIAVASASCESRAPAGKKDAAPLVLRRGLGGQPGSLDPQRAEDAFSFDVLRDLYEGLTTSSPSGEVLPAAAESWSVDASGMHYTFKLRDDARWSNGDPVLARNFVAAFRRAVDPATASGGADLLRAIENAPAILKGEMPAEKLGVRAIDDRTLDIMLSKPVPYFPDILTNTVASPVHDSSLVESGSFSNGGGTISNGPYSLAEVTPGANLRLVRNKFYWNASAVNWTRTRRRKTSTASGKAWSRC